MKRLISLCAILTCVLLISCRSNDPSAHYCIDGYMEGFGDEAITLYLVDLAAPEKAIDSTLLSDGHFSFEGNIDTPFVAYIVGTTSKGKARSFIAIEGGDIFLDMQTDSLSGTPLNDAMNAFRRGMHEERYYDVLSQYLTQYRNATNPTERHLAEAAYDSIDALRLADLQMAAIACFKNNRNNVVGAYALWRWANEVRPTLAEMELYLKQADATVKTFPPLAKVVSELEAADNTDAGKHYTDVAGIDYATSEKTMLSNMIDGHLVLVDFWASWCRPCRQEISENLIRIYEKYKEQGLLVVGLDVWDTPKDHDRAVQQLGITYPQLIDTTRVATDRYGVNSIPETILIGSDGIIIARGLRGEEIEKAVVAALESKETK